MAPDMPPLWNIGSTPMQVSCAGLEGIPLGKLQRVRHDVAMRQHGGLRRAGGAAGVEQHRHIIMGIDGDRLEPPAIFGQQRLERDGAANDELSVSAIHTSGMPISVSRWQRTS